MSAEVLRKAAALMRDDWSMCADMEGITLTDPVWRRGKTWLMVAGWLDECAGLAAALDADRFWTHPAGLDRIRDRALAVAHAYLGSDA